MVSLLNDKRVAAGKKPMGFINPFLYANPDCFQDIVRPLPRDQRDGEPAERQARRGGKEAHGVHQPFPLR